MRLIESTRCKRVSLPQVIHPLAASYWYCFAAKRRPDRRSQSCCRIFANRRAWNTALAPKRSTNQRPKIRHPTKVCSIRPTRSAFKTVNPDPLARASCWYSQAIHSLARRAGISIQRSSAGQTWKVSSASWYCFFKRPGSALPAAGSGLDSPGSLPKS